MDLPIIDGRVAVPVRALAYMTDWMPLDPETIAMLFSGRHPIRRRWQISAFKLHQDGTYAAVPPGAWDTICADIAELARDPKCNRYSEQRRRAVELLPAGVFVWKDGKDGLEDEYSRTYGRMTFVVARPGMADHEPTDDEMCARLERLTDLARSGGIEADAVPVSWPGSGGDVLLADRELAVVAALGQCPLDPIDNRLVEVNFNHPRLPLGPGPGPSDGAPLADGELALTAALGQGRSTSEQFDDHDPSDNTDLFNAAVKKLETWAQGRVTHRPGDGELNLKPLLADDDDRLVLEGFSAQQPSALNVKPGDDKSLPTPIATPLPSGMPLQRAQEAVIVAKLQELGYDPLAVPPPPRNSRSPGAKRKVRDALNYTPALFDHAWKRLRKDRRIVTAGP